MTLPSGAAAGPATAAQRSADFGPFVDPAGAATTPPARPNPSVPPAPRIVVSITPPPPPGATSSGSTSGVLSGCASWYCRAGSSPCTVNHPDSTSFDAYAAAGPQLRAALGSGWRGRIVSVEGIRVKLIDWCQCYQGQSNEKLLDLYYDVFARTGSAVTIRW